MNKNKAFDHSKYINWMKPEDAIPYEKNAKLHDEKQVKNIANSIRRFGWQQDTVITSDNVLVIGHGRRLAAIKLGCEMPYHMIDKTADELTEDDIRELRLADNLTNESGWDFDLRAEDMEGLDFEGFDFDFDVAGEEDPIAIQEDEPPEPPAEPKTKRGDIYQLGRHRLMCGDSTDEDDIAELMGDRKAELLLTDPPYGINAVHKDGKVHGDSNNGIIKNTKVYAPIIGDDTTDTARKSYEIAKEYTDNQVIFGGNYFTDFLLPSRCWVVWDKQNGEGSFADAELAWTSFDRVVKLYQFMWNGLIREGSRTVEGKTRVHPTQKPVGMLANIIKDFTEENDLILDCFGGSGSTLMACEQTGRKCFMMELDPHYIDVIIQRWENLTGEKAVLLNG